MLAKIVIAFFAVSGALAVTAATIQTEEESCRVCVNVVDTIKSSNISGAAVREHLSQLAPFLGLNEIKNLDSLPKTVEHQLESGVSSVEICQDLKLCTQLRWSSVIEPKANDDATSNTIQWVDEPCRVCVNVVDTAKSSNISGAAVREHLSQLEPFLALNEIKNLDGLAKTVEHQLESGVSSVEICQDLNLCTQLRWMDQTYSHDGSQGQQ